MLRRLCNFILPPECLICQELITEPQGLCADCFQKIQFIEKPYCDVCGYPLQEEVFKTCAPCLAKPPIFEKSRAALVYNDTSRDLLLKLKHCDRLDLAIPLARLMLQGSEDILLSADIIIPVPLHWKRLWFRRYNQATMLARAMAKIFLKRSGRLIPVVPALERIRATSSQGGKSNVARHSNVRGAFRVREKEKLSGKNVLLVDDVYTTGATLKSCARALLKAKAKNVYVISAARVVLGKDLSQE